LQTLHTQLLTNIPGIQLLPGLPAFESTEFLTNARNTLIIIDDLAQDLTAKDSGLSKFFAVHSHHLNASIVLLTQSLFVENKHYREASLNSNYFVLFYSPRMGNQVRYLSQQLDSGQSKSTNQSNSLQSVYKSAVDKPFSYLLCNLSCDCAAELRFRCSIFGEDCGFNTIWK